MIALVENIFFHVARVCVCVVLGAVSVEKNCWKLAVPTAAVIHILLAKPSHVVHDSAMVTAYFHFYLFFFLVWFVCFVSYLMILVDFFVVTESQKELLFCV